MTESLDLDALEAVARAATPGPWTARGLDDEPTVNHEFDTEGYGPGYGPHAYPDKPQDAVHIAAFDPPTALALIGRVREAEAKAANWAEIDRLALDNVLAERDAALARAQATEAELLEAHTHFAVQEGRLREAVTRAESAEATIARVRELHKPINRGAGGLKCSLCTTEDGFLELFPCFTIRALGGDQS